MMIKRNQKGFSLLELLIVVAIITLLIALGIVSYIPAQKKSRDSKRKGDLEQIRAALEMYRSDEGSYPATDDVDTTGCTGTSIASDDNTYMDPIPCDPKNSGDYQYSYSRITETSYQLTAKLELDTATGTCDVEGYYCVKNP